MKENSVSKHNKGFTLIELLAVIVILSVILAIATASVIGNINDSKKKAKYIAAKEIVSIAASYLATNKADDGAGENCVYVETLIKKNYLEKDVTNPATGKNGGFDNDTTSMVCLNKGNAAQSNYDSRDEGGKSIYDFDDYQYKFVNKDTAKNTTTKTTTKSNQSELCLGDERFVCDKNNPTKIVGLTEVGEEAFRSGSDLFIPDGATEIGPGAFSVPLTYEEDTGEIIDVNLIDEAGQIISGKEEAFMRTLEQFKEIREMPGFSERFSGVQIVHLPETLEKIGPFAFAGLNFVGDLIIPESVKDISYYAFYAAKFDGKLDIPESIETIKMGSFSEMGLTGELFIPNTVKKIDIGAFTGTKFDSVSLSKNTEYNQKANIGNVTIFTLLSFDKDTAINVR